MAAVAAAAAALGLCADVPAAEAGAPLPAAEPHAASALAVWDGLRWRSWWRAGAAPVRWQHAHPLVTAAVEWKTAAVGLDVGTVRFSGAGEAWRFNVVLLRIDPRRHDLALHVRRDAAGRALPWSVEDMPSDAAFALNAGMFDAVGPWGWIVLDGVERQPPGRGPLASAFVIDSAGNARIVAAHEMEAVRTRGVRWAVQSYPTALHDGGVVPIQLREPGHGVDIEHRDARLALGVQRDGRILVALTRFDGLAGLLDVVPLGPTLPEMAAIMGALGARQAVFLDGGISGQMAVRAGGAVQRWEGLRRVPLALVGRTRFPSAEGGVRKLQR